MPPAFRALPVLLRICADIDGLFVLGVGRIARKSGNEIHQLILATERLRACLMLAIQRSRRQPLPEGPTPVRRE